MFTCPSCQRPVNIYATSCQHCGGQLVPAGGPPAAEPPVRAPCAKCGHTRFVVVSPFRQLDGADDDSVRPLPVVAFLGDRRAHTAGSFRAHVCLGCGFTEWYAVELEQLANLAGKTPGVVLVDVQPGQAYR